MPRLESVRTFVGAVRDSETGELIQLPADVDQSVADRLTDEFAHLRSTDESDTKSSESETHTEDENSETETFRCGVNGCSRTVDSEDSTCWQHPSE